LRIKHDVLAFAESLAPGVRAAFLAAFADIKSSASRSAIEAAIARMDADAVFDALQMNRGAFGQFEEAMRAAYLQGGAAFIAAVPKVRAPDGLRLVARFDGRNPRAERWLSERSSALVTQIVAEQREVIRTALTAGMEAGKGPRSVALDLVGRVSGATRSGGVVGLSAPQATYVANARAELADPERMASYLERTRRDRRFDATVRRAMREGKPLPRATADKIVARYEANLLRLRGETIARTEMLASMHEAQEEGLRQMVDTGALRSDQITREWSAAFDKATRPTHAAADGQKAGSEETFAVGGYRMKYPGDRSLGAPASEIISCRCNVRISLDFLGGLR
jgi:hypothetical protein